MPQGGEEENDITLAETALALALREGFRDSRARSSCVVSRTLKMSDDSGEPVQGLETVGGGLQPDELKTERCSTVVDGLAVAEKGIEQKRRFTGARREAATICATDLDVVRVASLDPHSTGGEVFKLSVADIASFG